MISSKNTKPKITKLPATPELRRLWLRFRSVWERGVLAYNNYLDTLKASQLELLYDFAKLSLFTNSFSEILQKHPELKDLVHNDRDRFCMHDLYLSLSRRLGRTEKLPQSAQLEINMRTRIGRNTWDESVVL